MKVQSDIRGEVAILAISGEFNADSTAKFHEVVEHTRGSQIRDFVVDMGGITAIDSAGLEALLRLQRDCEELLGMVQFCGADATLRKILEICRLDKQLSLHGSVDEALASLVSQE